MRTARCQVRLTGRADKRQQGVVGTVVGEGGAYQALFEVMKSVKVVASGNNDLPAAATGQSAAWHPQRVARHTRLATPHLRRWTARSNRCKAQRTPVRKRKGGYPGAGANVERTSQFGSGAKVSCLKTVWGHMPVIDALLNHPGMA